MIILKILGCWLAFNGGVALGLSWLTRKKIAFRRTASPFARRRLDGTARTDARVTAPTHARRSPSQDPS